MTNKLSHNKTNRMPDLIHQLAKYNELEKIKELLPKSPGLLNKKDELGQSPLLWAASRGHLELVDYLLSFNPDLECSTNQPEGQHHNYTALHWAYKRKYHDVVLSLIEAGAKDACMISGIYFIHKLAQYNELEKIKELLKKNPDLLDKQDRYGQTPLIWAADYGHLELVNYLISLGADLECSTVDPGSLQHNYTALHWAYKRKYYDVVISLINAGAKDRGLQIDSEYLTSKKTERPSQLMPVAFFPRGKKAVKLEVENKDIEFEWSRKW